MNYCEAVRIELKYEVIFNINSLLLNSTNNELLCFQSDPNMFNILNRLCKAVISKNPSLSFLKSICKWNTKHSCNLAFSFNRLYCILDFSSIARLFWLKIIIQFEITIYVKSIKFNQTNFKSKF